MGSKAAPFRKPASDDPNRDEPRGVSALRQSKTEQLLKRIAEAVEMPQTSFYRPLNAVDVGTPTAASSAASDAECAELLAAFSLFSDPEDRRRLVELVQEMAKRG